MGLPRVASTTIADSQEHKIRDALRSVEPYVDVCVLVDAGVKDRTIDVAREVCGVKLVVVPYRWKDDFADARNVALDAAQLFGQARWAVTVDTDERLDLADLAGEKMLVALAPFSEDLSRAGCDPTRPVPSTDPRFLKTYLAFVEHAHPEVDVLHARCVDGSYAKERIVRLPTTRRWRGRVHETLSPVQLEAPFRFREIAKTEAELARKNARDLEILQAEVETEEGCVDARSWYYLGDVLARTGRKIEAALAFQECFELTTWDEEAAWAQYRRAQCLFEPKTKETARQAVEACALGMTRHAGVAELPWLASWICHAVDDHQQAVRWASVAAQMNQDLERRWVQSASGKSRDVALRLPSPRRGRTGFTYPLALHDGPWDTLRRSLPHLGMKEEAYLADQVRVQELASRLGGRPTLVLRDAATSALTTSSSKEDVPPAKEVLPSFADVVLFDDEHPLVDESHVHFTNPSIHRAADGTWRCAVRCVNYRIRPDGSYEVPPPGSVETRNFLLRFDVREEGTWDGQSVHCVRTDEIVPARAWLEKTTSFPIHGLEDLRLFEHDGEIYALSVVADAPGQPSAGSREVAFTFLHEKKDGTGYKAVLEPMRGPWSRHHQKNWTPLDGLSAQVPTFLYELVTHPVRVALDTASGDARVLVRREEGSLVEDVLANPLAVSSDCFLVGREDCLRGGTQAVLVDAPQGRRRLCVGHYVKERRGQRRLYTHAFALLSEDGARLERVSRPFRLAPHGLGIEFAAGLAVEGPYAYVSFGVDDREARVGRVLLDDVWRLLHDPNDSNLRRRGEG